MYMSRLRLRTGIDSRTLAELVCSSEYKAHQYLWSLFSNSENQTRGFLYRKEARQGRPQFYVVSKEAPEPRDACWLLEHKRYEPRLRRGQRLGFTVRVNPVVTRKVEGDKRRRHDVVMDTKNSLRQREIPKDQWPSAGELMRGAGLQWLQKRAPAGGFEIDVGEVFIDGYIQHHFPRKGGEIRFSTLDIAGVLTVADARSFTKILYSGLGPAKAFGCGLMLVRRLP